MNLFFSCDWGTSNFRLRLVDADKGRPLSEIKTDQGIAMTFDAWKRSGKNEEHRKGFYQNYLFEQVRKISGSFAGSVENLPIILSGMASSSIGMLELPYKKLPLQCDGSDLVVHTIGAGQDQPHKIILISGVSSEMDAMRGEETILVGCDIAKDETKQLFLFPGTHSKHVLVEDGVVQSIATFMTGEVFELLSNKSILAASVVKNDPGPDIRNQPFEDGVNEGASSNILNSIFHVRTNQLFKKMTADANYFYLSGLLIGQELKGVLENKPAAITLVCTEGLQKVYQTALHILELNDRLDYKNADDALINGQVRIMQQTGYQINFHE
jgi:2-dehydro-3-deoxygalactonokinase